MDVCGGGTISTTTSSITFENNHPEACTLSGCTLPGWPTTDPVVPARANGTDGHASRRSFPAFIRRRLQLQCQLLPQADGSGDQSSVEPNPGEVAKSRALSNALPLA
jgi:hypothetical protein